MKTNSSDNTEPRWQKNARGELSPPRSIKQLLCANTRSRQAHLEIVQNRPHQRSQAASWRFSTRRSGSAPPHRRQLRWENDSCQRPANLPRAAKRRPVAQRTKQSIPPTEAGDKNKFVPGIEQKDTGRGRNKIRGNAHH